MSDTKQFYEEMKARMVDYKTNILGIAEKGKRRGREYDHILPSQQWPLNLWSGIQRQSIEYFSKNDIRWHRERDNLLSSQVLCINVFFPLRNHPHLLDNMLREFYPSLDRVNSVDFEYIGPQDYFNEGGGRGYNRTSADVSIKWKDNKDADNLLLVEFKFTEQNFGGCGRGENPHPEWCDDGKFILESPETACYRASEKKRPYWKKIMPEQGEGILKLSMLKKTPCCPFKHEFYQLMRNQLFAHCLANDSDVKLHTAEFAVCHDERNKDIVTLSHPVEGNRDAFAVWESFLRTPTTFKHFTVQHLLHHIDQSVSLPTEIKEWRAFLNERYGL